MTQIHEVQCDSCKIKKKMKKEMYGFYNPPMFWYYSEDTKQDYCPKCRKKLKQYLKRCMTR